MKYSYDAINIALYTIIAIGVIAMIAVMYFFYFKDRIKERKKRKKLSKKLKDKETREILLAYWWVFFIIGFFLIYGLLYLLGAFSGTTSTNQDYNHCNTVTDSNGEDHDVDCERDYNQTDREMDYYDDYDHNY